MSVLGLDLSLNHGGAVALSESGSVDGYWFVTDRKGAVDRGKSRGVRSPVKKKGMDAEQHQLNRMYFYTRWLWDIVMEAQPEYAGIEGYAFAAISNSSYQYGELGGLARYVLTHRTSCKLRVHDPQSVKMFATGKGNAPTPALLDAVCDLEPEMFARWTSIERGLKGNPVGEDLAVAYWIAQLVCVELALREGRMRLSSMKAHEIRVFNRVTKAYPVNLLDRDWLKR
jgi:Holliday junction resolvasome RuvABC endonuclease subunit